jgi:IMP dehydrogenase/GMP reductase
MEENAIKFMEAMSFPRKYIDDFKTSGKVYVSYEDGIKELGEDVLVQEIAEQVRELCGEKYVIYHIIVSMYNGDNTVNCMLGMKNQEEFDMHYQSAGDGIVFVFCYNCDFPEGSEPGEIKVKFDTTTKSYIRIG